MGMSCYTDWKFIRAGNYDKAKGLLKYLTYREDRDNHVPRPWPGPLGGLWVGQELAGDH